MLFENKVTAPLSTVLSAVALSCWAITAQAQVNTQPVAPDTSSLKGIFETAWQRQPEARALQLRRDAVQAQARAANLLTPEAPALELSQRSDRATGNYGAREAEVGVAIPLWLPGQRTASADLAKAEISFVERRLLASQLRLAAAVREAWWNWQRARIDAELAREQLTNAQRLASDVARRALAGDLARADQHQADGAAAAAEALAAQAQAASVSALSQLLAFTGGVAPQASLPTVVSEPAPNTAGHEAHPLLAELEERLAISERTATLLNTQKRANPELTVATTRDRGAFGERYGQTVMVGIRLPFGAGARADARIAAAQADAIEVQSQLILEKDRVQSEQRATASRAEAAQIQLNAAKRRAQLAKESRGFFDKSFKLGETDLPTRLRIEAEAVEAERQEARSQIELASAVSAWRQSLGLLPE